MRESFLISITGAAVIFHLLKRQCSHQNWTRIVRILVHLSFELRNSLRQFFLSHVKRHEAFIARRGIVIKLDGFLQGSLSANRIMNRPRCEIQFALQKSGPGSVWVFLGLLLDSPS